MVGFEVGPCLGSVVKEKGWTFPTRVGRRGVVSTKKPTAPIVSTTALARHLGLSRWTISRVLNGHTDVKSETTRRVQEAMRELGFVPSPLGRALRGVSTGVIGVCFQAIGSPIVARKIATLQRILREAGYRALFEVSDDGPALETQIVRHFVATRVDGLILVGGMTEENSKAIPNLLRQNRIPLVLVDPIRRFPVPTVELHRELGMHLALDHLMTQGHRRFALLGIDEQVAYGRDRWAGIKTFIATHNLSLERNIVPLSEPKPPALDFEYGRRLAQRLLELPDRPTATVALNDQVAVGAMARLQQAGLAIPRDMAIVGFDNLDVSAHVTPLLTTVDQHVESLMQTAVDLLRDQTGGEVVPDPAPHRAVEPLLVVRESSVSPARAS